MIDKNLIDIQEELKKTRRKLSDAEWEGREDEGRSQKSDQRSLKWRLWAVGAGRGEWRLVEKFLIDLLVQ